MAIDRGRTYQRLIVERCMEYMCVVNAAPAKSRAQVSEQQLAEQNANRTGQGLEDLARPAPTPRSISGSRSKLSGTYVRATHSVVVGGTIHLTPIAIRCAVGTPRYS